MVFPMIDVAETGQIDRKTLTEWVVCKTFLSFFGILADLFSLLDLIK